MKSEIKMKFTVIFLAGAFALNLTACSNKKENNEAYNEFKSEIDDFCEQINVADNNINAISPDDENYLSSLINELKELDQEFYDFSMLDFPEEYDYLEEVADEAYLYMENAFIAYKDLFENDYDSELLQEKYEYASENYSRAYKRIQVIVTFLNGETEEEKYSQ